MHRYERILRLAIAQLVHFTYIHQLRKARHNSKRHALHNHRRGAALVRL